MLLLFYDIFKCYFFPKYFRFSLCTLFSCPTTFHVPFSSGILLGWKLLFSLALVSKTLIRFSNFILSFHINPVLELKAVF